MKLHAPQKTAQLPRARSARILAYHHIVARTERSMREAIRVNWYRSPGGTVVRCNVWCWPRDRRDSPRSGHGSAGGGGYDKRGAALGAALGAAGIELGGDLAGALSTDSALRELARALGYRGQLLSLRGEA